MKDVVSRILLLLDFATISEESASLSDLIKMLSVAGNFDATTKRYSYGEFRTFPGVGTMFSDLIKQAGYADSNKGVKRILSAVRVNKLDRRVGDEDRPVSEDDLMQVEGSGDTKIKQFLILYRNKRRDGAQIFVVLP